MMQRIDLKRAEEVHQLVCETIEGEFGEGEAGFVAFMNSLEPGSRASICNQLAVIATKLDIGSVPQESALKAARFLGRQLRETKALLESITKITPSVIRSIGEARGKRIATEAEYFEQRAIFQAVVGSGDSKAFQAFTEQTASALEQDGLP